MRHARQRTNCAALRQKAGLGKGSGWVGGHVPGQRRDTGHDAHTLTLVGTRACRLEGGLSKQSLGPTNRECKLIQADYKLRAKETMSW